MGIPATAIAAMVGRRLREVVDLALIPESALITGLIDSENLLYLDLEIGRTTVEAVIAG